MKNIRFALILFMLIFFGLLPFLIMGCSSGRENILKQNQSDPTDPGLKPEIDPNVECPFLSGMKGQNNQCSHDWINMRQEECEEHSDKETCDHDSHESNCCKDHDGHSTGENHDMNDNNHHSDNTEHHH